MILWSGDYSARIQFNGPLKTEIKGELVDDATLKSNKACEVYGRFEEVMTYEKKQLEKFIKADFRFVCVTDKQPPEEIKLASELIRASDLKTHSSTIFISQKFKKNILKLEQYSVVSTQNSPKSSSK